MSKDIYKRLDEIEQIMLGHTPGDWQMDPDSINKYNDLKEIAVVSGATKLASINGVTMGDVQNAYLMAASKDMFKALKKVVKYNLQGAYRTFDDESVAILNECIDAIKKAEGNG